MNISKRKEINEVGSWEIEGETLAGTLNIDNSNNIMLTIHKSDLVGGKPIIKGKTAHKPYILLKTFLNKNGPGYYTHIA